MNLLDLLVAGNVEEFNANRGQRRRIDLFAADLAAAKIAGVDLSNANLEKSDLTGADLTGATLLKADLSGIDASEAVFVDATGVGMKMKEAVLDEADFTGADLSHADLSESSFASVRAPGIKLSGAKLRETDLTNADLTGGDLVEARFHQAKLIGTNLTDADLTEATFQECDLSNADLTGVIAHRTRFGGSNLTGAKLVRGQFVEANLQGADLSSADLSAADLSRANLSDAKLVGAVLKGAILSGAVLDRVDLADLDLEDVDMSGLDPRALGLTEGQIASLAAEGASGATNDAPLRFTDVSVARGPSGVAVLWENVDSDEALSIRWAFAPTAGEMRAGVLPISAEGVLARSVVATDDGFSVLVLQERPGGEALVRWKLDASGAIGGSRADVIGYEPGVKPVMRWQDGAVLVWGLARRGPTLVVQRVLDEGIELVHSEKIATARGFLGGPGTVVAHKAGTVASVGSRGASSPLRVPTAFPGGGQLTVAVPVGDRVLVAWAEQREGERLGGIRTAWLAPGIAPKPQALADCAGEIAGIDAIVEGDNVRIAWIEITRAGYAVKHALAEGEIKTVPLDADAEIEELRFTSQSDGSAPLLALVTVDEALLVVGLDGTAVAHLV